MMGPLSFEFCLLFHRQAGDGLQFVLAEYRTVNLPSQKIPSANMNATIIGLSRTLVQQTSKSLQ